MTDFFSFDTKILSMLNGISQNKIGKNEKPRLVKKKYGHC